MAAVEAERAAERATRLAERRALRGLPPEHDLEAGMRTILANPFVTEALRERVLAAFSAVLVPGINGQAYVRWRRLLIRAATPPGVRINRSAIAERDGWRCGFCGGAVLRDPPRPGWTHPLAPSLDHIKALAAGGLHTPDNVRLAHFACNAAGSALSSAQIAFRVQSWKRGTSGRLRQGA